MLPWRRSPLTTTPTATATSRLARGATAPRRRSLGRRVQPSDQSHPVQWSLRRLRWSAVYDGFGRRLKTTQQSVEADRRQRHRHGHHCDLRSLGRIFGDRRRCHRHKSVEGLRPRHERHRWTRSHEHLSPLRCFYRHPPITHNHLLPPTDYWPIYLR